MTNEYIEFQLYDWTEDHEINDKKTNVFIIHSFGRCENEENKRKEGKSVYMKIKNFKPYFYLLIPNKFQDINNRDIITQEFIYPLLLYLKNKIKYTVQIEYMLEYEKKADYFENGKKYWFIKLIFKSYFQMLSYKKYLENNEIIISNNKYNCILYESNIPPMLRCFHIQNIRGCSWIRIKTSNCIFIKNSISYCDIEIEVDYTKIEPITKTSNALFTICSFDIECYSEDGEFPQSKRQNDKIIQIGFTYTLLGQSIPYRKYIACLKKTDYINDDIIVECFNTEKELLEAFVKEINENNCDIITGYNIYFFDEKYIYDRAHHINNYPEISNISKLRNKKCTFREGKLSSAAMGDNIYYYWITPGRIHIDLMKDIKITYSLPTYKLDYVSSNFIKGKILSYKINSRKVELYCDNVSDIYNDDYIHIEILKNVITDYVTDTKFLVELVDIENKKIVIYDKDNELYILNDLSNYTLFWTQAKDDISPKDIFSSYVGSSKDRSIIAKYCIKDCTLVNILINKLETITKNIEMANVCYVPLSYLFTRGQGIKIFSLCAKEYRNNYIFPVLHKIKNKCNKCGIIYINLYTCPKCNIDISNDDFVNDKNYYEGAIVFKPTPSIEYEAIAVKDYASLYPSSIIHKNISIETLVTDEKYDNLKNITYYECKYSDNNNNLIKCKYAKSEKEMGILPKILNNLLTERKNIKKKMKDEKDPFKYNILNCKQLAVKVTANSLYGQLGSSFSHIKKPELAASTTSTGRDMLIFAKKFDEEIFSFIYNTIQYYIKNNDYCSINILLNSFKYADETKKYLLNFVNNIKHITIQPIVKYGDTDSIFSCYKLKENCINYENINIKYNIINFSYKLIEPLLDTNIKTCINIIFNNFYKNKDYIDYIDIYDNKYNNIPKDVLIFFKDYMECGYLPLLWTLQELYENNKYEYIFIKLSQWISLTFNIYSFKIVNLKESRKQSLCNILYEKLDKMIEYGYLTITDEMIKEFIEFIKLLSYYSEIKLSENLFVKNTKKLFTHEIKYKWEYSLYNKSFNDNINEFINNIEYNNENFKKSLITLIFYDNELNINDLKVKIENIISSINDKNFLGFKDYDVNIKKFIIKYNKYNGRKTLNEIVERFLEIDLNLNFDKYVDDHKYQIINFFDENIKMNNNVYLRFLPRWDIKTNIIIIDLYNNGSYLINNDTVKYTIDIGVLTGMLIKYKLDYPHDCEYEKTFWPFILLTNKKYVGNKYEMDSNKYKRDFMGIVLKRRDNAPIVKEVVSNIIDNILKNTDKNEIMKYVDKLIEDIFKKKYDIKYFIQTKNLKSKSSYKDWTKIAHICLANRIQERDPGNIIQSGTRLEFAYIKIKNKNKNTLQGDMIETKDYILNNNLEIDYLHYLSNQIMNPVLQILELIVDNPKKIFDDYQYYYSKNKYEILIDEILNSIKKIKKDTIYNNIIKTLKYIKNIKNIIILINTLKIKTLKYIKNIKKYNY